MVVVPAPDSTGWAPSVHRRGTHSHLQWDLIPFSVMQASMQTEHSHIIKFRIHKQFLKNDGRALGKWWKGAGEVAQQVFLFSF